MKFTVTLLALFLAAALASSTVSARDFTVVDVRVVRNGVQQAVSQAVLDDGKATFGATTAYLVAVRHLDGTLTDTEGHRYFDGAWKLEIKDAVFDASGGASLVVALDERAPGRQPAHQDATLRVKAGESGALVHGADGTDYLIRIWRRADVNS